MNKLIMLRISLCRPGGVVVTQSPPKQKARVQIRSDASRPVTKLIGTASAGDTHSLARRTNPPTASIVPRHRVT